MKNFAEILNLDNLIEKLSLANTPAYLYKHYRPDSSIYEMSRFFTTNELIDFLKPLINSIKTTKDLAIVYSIIMALTFKSADDVDMFFKVFSEHELRWSDKISELYFLNNSIKNVEILINASNNAAEKILNEPTFSYQQI
jgi:hypothetical protein